MMWSIDLISEKLGDSLNPVFVKEFRQFLRSRGRSLGWLVLMIIELLAFYLFFNCDRDGERRAIAVFYLVLLVSGALIMIGDVVCRWGNERSIDGITPEFTTALSPGVIVHGKWQAMLAAGGLTLLVGLPFALFSIIRCLGSGRHQLDPASLLFLGLYFLAAPAAFWLMIFLTVSTRVRRNNPVVFIIIALILGWIIMCVNSIDDPVEMNRVDFVRVYWQVGLAAAIFGAAGFFSALGKFLPVTVDRLRRARWALVAGAVAAFLPGVLGQNYDLTFGLLVWLALLGTFIGLDEVFPMVRGRCLSGGAVRSMGLAFLTLLAAAALLKPEDSGGRFGLCFALLILVYAEVAVLLRQHRCPFNTLPLFLLIAATANLPALASIFHYNSIYCLFSPWIAGFDRHGYWAPGWCAGLAFLLLAAIAVSRRFSLSPRRRESDGTSVLLSPWIRWGNAFSAKLGDNLNPVLVKELRQFCRNRSLQYGAIGLLVLQAAGFYFGRLCKNQGDLRGLASWSLYLTVGAAWVVIGIAMSRWSKERSLDGLTPEFTTTLSPVKILNGKLASSLLAGAAAMAVGLPLVVFLLSRCWHNWETRFDGDRLLLLGLYFFVVPPVTAMMALLTLGGRGRKNNLNPAILLLLPAIIVWFVIVSTALDRYERFKTAWTHEAGTIAAVTAVIFTAYFYFAALGRLQPARCDRTLRSHLALAVGALAVILGTLWFGCYKAGGDILVWLAACCVVFNVGEGSQTRFGGAVRAMALSFLILVLGVVLAIKGELEFPNFVIGFLLLIYAELAVFLRQWGVRLGGFEILILIAAGGNLLALPAAFGGGSAWLAFSFGLAGRENALNGLLWSGIWALLLLILIACRSRFPIAPRRHT